jgi:uncharacterized protein YbjQ (UPF0145 family)
VNDVFLELGIQLLFVLIPLAFAYVIGSAIERSHLQSLKKRELGVGKRVTTVCLQHGHSDWSLNQPALVMGSTVVSIDYFKRFLASWRMVFGGSIRSYESLLERARREAMLRMQEQAHELGRNAIVNVRLETARIASSFANGKGTTGVEVLAYGTAVVVDHQPSRAIALQEDAAPPWERATEPATTEVPR